MLYLHNILSGVWLIDPDFANNYLPTVAAFMRGDNLNFGDRIPERFSSIYCGCDELVLDEIDSIPKGSVGIINISGAITKHDQFCGPAGMISKSNVLREFFSNDHIKGVIIKIDSGGGEGNAMRVMMDTIADRNKPVVAFIDDMACSAAYGIASVCDVIVANSAVARVGSIGTYMTVADYSKYWELQGIRLIDVYASQSKDKNSEYFEAIKGNLEPLRSIADRYNSDFIESVRQNRSDKLSDNQKLWSTGKAFFADEALKIGLIDNIDTFQNTLNYFV
jgi:signal peptide peptidase SppA